MFRGRLFFTAGYIATLVVVHVHLLFCVNCNTNNQNQQQQLLHKNSCGDIDNIGFPFRLKSDPLDTCGDQNFELECENNRTVLYLYSGKYYVQAINYDDNRIRVVDVGIQRNNCFSLPPHSLTNPDVDIGAIDPYYISSDSNGFVMFLSCEKPVKSPLYIDTNNSSASCKIGRGGGGKHSYVLFGGFSLSWSEVENLCRVDMIFPARQLQNQDGSLRESNMTSLLEVHNALADGFYLYWDFDRTYKQCIRQARCSFNYAQNITGACPKDHYLHGIRAFLDGLKHFSWKNQLSSDYYYVRQLPKNFRKSFYLGKDLKKLLDLPLEKRKAPLLLNFIPNYTSKLADIPRQRKKKASSSTASTEQAASTSEPADQPSTSAPHSIPVQEKKRRRRLVKTAEMEKPKKKVLNLLADLPEDMEDAPPPPKPKRIKKAQPKAKVAEVDAEDEDAVPISQLAEKTTSAPSKRPAEVQPPKSTAAKKQKSSAGTSSGSRVAKVPWEPKVTLEDRPVYTHESAADVEIGVALSTAVLLGGDMEKNEKKSGYENYTLMLQHSVQAIQHAHSFSMVAFETGKRLEDLEKEFALLHKQNRAQQLKMKELEDQAEEAIKAKQIADEKLGAAEAVKSVAIAQQKEAEEKAAQAEKERQEALASKKTELEAAYNEGMADVAEDYKLQVKQACNKGYTMGWNALAKKLDLPADSPWRKTKAMCLPCPLPPSEDESESEAEAEDEDKDEDKDEALVRKAKSPPQIDLTGDEEVDAAPKKADFGTLSSDLLLVGRSIDETVAEIDAEVAADKLAEVATDKAAEVSANKEAEVVVDKEADSVVEKGAEIIPPEPSDVPAQSSANAEVA